MDGYTHSPGDHCGSSSLRNLAAYYDWGFSEAECFGLGAGIGFGYYDEGPASRMIMGRSAHLESAFFDHLDIDVTHTDGQSRADAWSALESRVADGPVLCFVDLYYLPYFGTDTHFGPHILAVIDVDDESVTLSDSEFPEVQTVSRDTFDDAWTSDYGFGPLERQWLAVNDPEIGADTADATRAAVSLATATMLDGAGSWGGAGVAAIREFAAELPDWNDLDDASWAARFAYQNIERRGTGGGAFRRLYAKFLDSLGVDAGFDATYGERMHGIADDWTDVAGVLKDASETDDEDERGALFADAAERVHDLADREEALFSDLADD